MFTEKPNAVNNIAVYYSRAVEMCSETILKQVVPHECSQLFRQGRKVSWESAMPGSNVKGKKPSMSIFSL